MDRFIAYDKYDLLPWWIKWPGKWPSLLDSLTERFVKDMGLEAITNELILQQNPAVIIESAMFKGGTPIKVLKGVMPTAKTKSLPLDTWHIRGGMKIWHLHLKDRIFVMNEKQAQEYANQAVAKCREVLASVKQVGYDEAAAVAMDVGKMTGK